MGIVRVLLNGLKLVALLVAVLIPLGLLALVISSMTSSFPVDWQNSAAVLLINRFGTIFGGKVWNYIYATVSSLTTKWISSNQSFVGIVPSGIMNAIVGILSLVILFAIVRFAWSLFTEEKSWSDISKGVNLANARNLALIIGFMQLVAAFYSGSYDDSEWIGVVIVVLIGLFIYRLNKTVFAKNVLIGTLVATFALVLLILAMLPSSSSTALVGIIASEGVDTGAVTAGISFIDILIPPGLSLFVMTALVWVFLQTMPGVDGKG